MAVKIYVIEDHDEWITAFSTWWEQDRLRPEFKDFEIAWANKFQLRSMHSVVDAILAETDPVILIVDYDLGIQGPTDILNIVQKIKDKAIRDPQYDKVIDSLALNQSGRAGLLFLAAALANSNIPAVAAVQVSMSERPMNKRELKAENAEPGIYPIVKLSTDLGRLKLFDGPTKSAIASEEDGYRVRIGKVFEQSAPFLRRDGGAFRQLGPLLDRLQTWVHASDDRRAPDVLLHSGAALWSFLDISPESGSFFADVMSQGRYPFIDGLRGFGDSSPPCFNIASGYLAALAAYRRANPTGDWRAKFKPEQGRALGDVRNLAIANFSDERSQAWRAELTRATCEMFLRLFNDGSHDTLDEARIGPGKLEFVLDISQEQVAGLREKLMLRRTQLISLMRNHASFAKSARLESSANDSKPLVHDRSYWVWEVMLLRALAQLDSHDVLGREPTSFEIHWAQELTPPRAVVRFQSRALSVSQPA